MRGKNNPFFGKRHSEEAKLKMSQAHKGKKFSEEHKRRIGEANKKAWMNEEYKQRMLKSRPFYFRGKKLSEETRRKLSKACMGRVPWNKGRGEYLSKEARERVRQGVKEKMKEHWADPTFREKQVSLIRETMKQKWADPAFRLRMFTPQHRKNLSISFKASYRNGRRTPKYKGKPRLDLSVEAKRKIGERAAQRLRELWKDPNYQKQMVELTCTLWKTPTLPEKQLGEMLQTVCPGEYRYVGDGSLIIGGKCPDFANCNGERKIIEMFGDYWHRGEIPQDRIDTFKPFGFDTLIVWEHELKDPQLPQKIMAFHKLQAKK